MPLPTMRSSLVKVGERSLYSRAGPLRISSMLHKLSLISLYHYNTLIHEVKEFQRIPLTQYYTLLFAVEIPNPSFFHSIHANEYRGISSAFPSPSPSDQCLYKSTRLPSNEC